MPTSSIIEPKANSQKPIAKSQRIVGLFGGSFNPIHNGHIALAKAVRQQCGLDEVWLVVSPQNPLKQESDLLDDLLRYEMACEALKDVEGVKASDYELHLPKPSYTWNTLKKLKEDYPDYTFILLIGGDNWAHFERWRHWQDILREYDVIVYPRDEHPGTIDVPLLPVSSTMIRQRVKEGKSIEGLVPESIISMVKTLYIK
jgi:nicotinate-nucleotide adenylyltransferase